MECNPLPMSTLMKRLTNLFLTITRDLFNNDPEGVMEDYSEKAAHPLTGSIRDWRNQAEFINAL
jgi:hypothetical protein